MADYEKELNKEQLRVVREGDGPCLVLSGPGSGKTHTLVYRTVYLLEKGIPADRIMLLTFTKKAAREMLSRINDLTGEKGKEICGGTFHHVGNLFLRTYASQIGYFPGYVIIDEEDGKNLLKKILKERKETGLPKAALMQKIISLASNSKESITDIINRKFPHLEEHLEVVREVAEEYSKLKREGNLMDYDDLLLNWLKLLSLEEAGKEISSRFLYVLIDEYQDTNKLQDEIVKRISGIHGNVLAVGDDAQSIYSFRAADIENILRFSKNYREAKIFRLETNYRSTPEILGVANEVISRNTRKLEKTLRSVKKEGPLPVIAAFSSAFKEAEFIADTLEEQGDLSDTAVLFRAHYQCIELEMELLKRRIPYRVRGGVRFFEQTHIKDVTAFLRILLNFRDETSWRRIFLLQEGIGEANAEKIIKEIFTKDTLEEVFKEKQRIAQKFSSQVEKGIALVLSILERAKNKNAPEAISIFLQDYYRQYLNLSFENASERENDIKKTIELSKKYKSLEEMLSEFSLSEDFTKESALKGAVTLSTVHQAKGLEWKTVFVISLKEGEFPHFKSVEEGFLEEERRLFYVAITRCKENLFLTYSLYGMRGKEYTTPSSFLQEAGIVAFQEEIVELDEGEWEPF